MFKRLRWYKDRLAAMSGAEMGHRLSEYLRKVKDRLFGCKPVVARDFGILPELPGLRVGLISWDIAPKTLENWAHHANIFLELRPEFFGVKWPGSSPSERWHIDPKSRDLWPNEIFCFAIDYRQAERRGDIKFVWELNRLQYLQPIAALAFKTRDQDLSNFCLAELESWIDSNPPYLGVNWNSGIELSLRLVSIFVVTTLTGPSISRDLRSKVWTTLYAHAFWIDRYPSKFSSANNHLTAEGLGLFLVGTLCPHFSEANIWRSKGWQILKESAEQQILPDGVGSEQATAYASSVLETLLVGQKIAEAYDVEIPDSYVRKLTLGGEYLRWLCDSRGNVPHIGDDDNACVLGCPSLETRYTASVTACLATATKRLDMVPPHVEPSLRNAFFNLSDTSDFMPYGVRQFANGGITIGRHKSRSGDIMFAFDHGNLGFLSIAAHGHADALSVWLHLGGQEIFVDAGTYLYHSSHDERSYFRSTPAHNTLTLANTSSSEMAGNFNWSRKAQTTRRKFSMQPGAWQCEAEHDGYCRSYAVKHRRSVSVLAASGVTISDMLIGETSQKVDISFLIHPCLTARHEGSAILILDGELELVRIRHESGLKTKLGLPGSPDQGWYSPVFGTKYPTTKIVFSGILPPHHEALTHVTWAH